MERVQFQKSLSYLAKDTNSTFSEQNVRQEDPVLPPVRARHNASSIGLGQIILLLLEVDIVRSIVTHAKTFDFELFVVKRFHLRGGVDLFSMKAQHAAPKTSQPAKLTDVTTFLFQHLSKI